MTSVQVGQVEFGLFLEPAVDKYREVVAAARYADAAGLELIGIQDHPYQRKFLDTWTLVADLAARTERVRLFPDVACLPLRPPAMLAKAVASLDVMSGGRIELGLGSGAFWEAITAMGGPSRSPREAFGAIEEALQVIRQVWSGGRGLKFAGEHYQLAGMNAGPAPSHDVQVWIGGKGPKMLRLIGASADGWLPSSGWAGPEVLDELGKRIDDAAAAAGRDPAEVKRVYNVWGLISDEVSEGFLKGPAGRWADELVSLAREQRIGAFVFGPDGSDVPGQIRRFAEEVVPEVRRQLAQ